MTDFRGVLWDIDGTLIDSEPLHLACIRQVSETFGYVLPRAQEERFLGYDQTTVWLAIAGHFAGRVSEADWKEAVLAAYIARAEREARPFLGALEAIRSLAAAGVPQACVSNSERRVVDANVAALGIAPYLQFTISRDDVALGKPDPQPYRMGCERLGLDPARGIAVEDSAAGAQAATAAGLHLVRVPADGHTAPPEASRLPDFRRVMGLFGLDGASLASPAGA